MSRQQPARENRTFEYWGGRPLKRTTSDLFIDRPGPANTIYSGTLTMELFFSLK